MHLFRKTFETELTYSAPPEVFKCTSVDLSLTFRDIKELKKTHRGTESCLHHSNSLGVLGLGFFLVY